MNKRQGKPYEWSEVKCSACGSLTTVPFKAIEGRPVYCRKCYIRDKKPRSIDRNGLRFDGFNFGAGEKGVWKHPRNDPEPSPYRESYKKRISRRLESAENRVGS